MRSPANDIPALWTQGVLPRYAKDLSAEVLERGWAICELLKFPEHLMKLAKDTTRDVADRKSVFLARIDRDSKEKAKGHGERSRSQLLLK